MPFNVQDDREVQEEKTWREHPREDRAQVVPALARLTEKDPRGHRVGASGGDRLFWLQEDLDLTPALLAHLAPVRTQSCRPPLPVRPQEHTCWLSNCAVLQVLQKEREAAQLGPKAKREELPAAAAPSRFNLRRKLQQSAQRRGSGGARKQLQQYQDPWAAAIVKP